MATNHSPRNKQGKPAGDNELILGLGAQIAQRRRELGIVQQQLADAALNSEGPSAARAAAMEQIEKFN